MSERLVMISNENLGEGQKEDRRPVISWDGPFCFVRGEPFVPQIFINQGISERAGEGFNSELILLDGRVKSHLDWSDAYAKAQEVIGAGRKVLWFLDLGLFDQLPFALNSNTQLLTLSLAVDHFCRDAWPKFKDHSLGVMLFKGDLDFSPMIDDSSPILGNFQGWLRDQFGSLENFCQETALGVECFEEATPSRLSLSRRGKQLLQSYAFNVAMDFFDLLTQAVPEEIALFALIDAAPIEEPAMVARFLGGHSLRLRLLLKNSPLPIQDVAWNGPSPFGSISQQLQSAAPLEQKYPVGLCIPNLGGAVDSAFDETVERLLHEKIPFRCIPEELLAAAWDGLDILIVCSASLSPLAVRMLRGFSAAGGEVVTVGEMIGLSQEQSFASWCQK